MAETNQTPAQPNHAGTSAPTLAQSLELELRALREADVMTDMAAELDRLRAELEVANKRLAYMSKLLVQNECLRAALLLAQPEIDHLEAWLDAIREALALAPSRETIR